MYDVIAKSYNELYGREQLNKLGFILSNYNFKSNQVVLDVGCGTGIITFEISKLVKKVIGVDKSNEMLKLKKK